MPLFHVCHRLPCFTKRHMATWPEQLRCSQGCEHVRTIAMSWLSGVIPSHTTVLGGQPHHFFSKLTNIRGRRPVNKEEESN